MCCSITQAEASTFADMLTINELTNNYCSKMDLSLEKFTKQNFEN